MFLIHNPGCSTNYMTEYIQSVPLITRYTGCPTNYMTAEDDLLRFQSQRRTQPEVPSGWGTTSP